MTEERTEKLLSRLANRMTEPVRPGLADEIKQQVPHQFGHYRKGLDTINIIIDLRVSKLTAAAAIVLTMVLFAGFVSRRGPGSGSLVEDAQFMANSLFGEPDRTYLTAGKIKYGRLRFQGRQAHFYGDVADPTDPNSILVHWKLDSGDYGVMFVDLREQRVSPGELIRLQAQMLSGGS